MQSAEPWRPTSPALPLLTCGQAASGSAVHPPGLLTGRHLPDSGWRTQGVKAHVTGGAAECGGTRNEGDTSPRLGAGKPVGRREPLHKAISHTALSSKNSQTLCRVVLSRSSIPFFFFAVPFSHLSTGAIGAPASWVHSLRCVVLHPSVFHAVT